jgi:hypothetical protein
LFSPRVTDLPHFLRLAIHYLFNIVISAVKPEATAVCMDFWMDDAQYRRIGAPLSGRQPLPRPDTPRQGTPDIIPGKSALYRRL